MLDGQYFAGLPFPWILRRGDGLLVAEGDGMLFPAAPATVSTRERRHLLSPSMRTGWTLCPSGYAAYIHAVSAIEDLWLVLYSLKISGLSKVQGKQESLSIRLKSSQLETYVSGAIEALGSTKNELNRILRTSIHEVRSINADLYNAIYQLRSSIEKSGYIAGRDMATIRNIEELSQFLKTRTDVLDVLSNPSVLSSTTSNVPVYRAFDRLVRSLTPTAKASGVKLNLSSPNGQSTSYVTSNRLFDVIPYLAIQNAIKYSPRDHAVKVEVVEEKMHIRVAVKSLGPLVKETEKELIFLSGFRGDFARRVSNEGTGVGLHMLQQLVQLHDDGKVNFEQTAPIRKIKNVPYARTTVNIVLRRSQSLSRTTG